jgi:Ni/Co efflux regulator RcnB
MKRFYATRLALALIAGCGAAVLFPTGANAQIHRQGPPSGRAIIVDRGPARSHVVVVDRSRPGWWRGQPAFVGYVGPRRGYYFAPGYGYYAIPRGYWQRPFVAGVVLPVRMRAYVVVAPATYGLAPAPAGYAWYYAGPGMVLAATSTGVIVQSVAGGW